MAKQCEGCGYYTPSNEPTACPGCDAALKFTFLPPAGKPAAPLVGLPTNAVDELSRRQRAAGGSRIHWGLVKAVCAALFTVGVMGVRFYFKQQARDEEAAETAAFASGLVKPGMHISHAARILDTGSGMHAPGRTRLRDRFDEDDDSDGSIETNDVKVTWRDGYVTEVEAKSSGTVRRRVTVTTGPAPRAEDEGVTDPETGEVTHPGERVIARPNGTR